MKIQLRNRRETKSTVSEPVKILVLVPAYNEAASIQHTIASVKNQTRQVDAIIVGDDCSTDNTAELAAKENVHVVTHALNLGNKAFNQQAIIDSAVFQNLVKSENPHNIVVCIIDADTILKNDAVEKIIRVFETDAEVMSASGYVVPSELDTMWQKARLVEYHASLNLQKSVQNDISSILVVSGCFAAIRYSSVLKHSGFDTRSITEDFGFTCEQNLDREKIRFVSDAICYTKEPPTLNILLKQLDRWYSGFFQNLKIHRKKILGCSNLKFTLLLVLFMSEGLYSLIIPLFLLSLWVFPGMFPFSAYNAFLFFLCLDIPLVVVPAMYGAAKHKQCLITLTSIPYFMMLRCIMMYAWWKAFIRELFTTKTLTKWDKGH